MVTARGRHWWRPTRAAVVYVVVMVCLYLVVEGLGVFGDVVQPVQDVLGLLLVLALLPVGLIVLPLYFAVFVLTGAYVGGGFPYMAEILLAIAVLLNAVFINWVARRRQRRRSPQQWAGE